jgi:hypothetical protein
MRTSIDLDLHDSEKIREPGTDEELDHFLAYQAGFHYEKSCMCAG